MNYTTEIKSRLPARQVLEFYGLTVDRAGFCKCPFHQGDNTGSLKVYDGEKGWHCFGCGAGTSVIDFVMQMFGLPFQAAQEKLNADFNLGLPIGKGLSPADRANAVKEARQRKEAAQELERKLQSLKDAADRALTAYVLADKVARRVKTGNAAAQRDAAWYNYCEAEYNLDQFKKGE
jgi:DNA primase